MSESPRRGSDELGSPRPVNPPPLMAIDLPNPPNIVISTCTAIPVQHTSTFTSAATTSSAASSSYSQTNQFMLNTRQIVTASRLDPDLLLASCANNKDIDDVDLDRMYMEAMLEDFKHNVSSNDVRSLSNSNTSATNGQSLLPQLSIAKMDPLSQVFCLKWNNHQNNLLTVLDHLYQTEAMCDVTLACDNTSIKCHKMILSACSSYFQTLFMENTCEHPIVFLKDIKIAEVRAILDYMYKGEVNVAQEELPGLLKVAELLRVKGLVEGEAGDKLLNSNFGKNGRPLVTTCLSEPPSASNHHSSAASATKMNGGSEHAGHYRERSADDRRASSSISEPKENNSSPTSAGMRPFMPGMPQIPMFPLPGMFPNLLGASREGIRGRDHDGDSSNEREGSPSPGSGGKRRKVASGSGGSSSSKESGPGHRDDQPMNMDMRNDRGDEKGLHHDLDKDMLPLPPGLDKSALANYVPSQRLEWKRYKQYTRNDIMSAIEEVKNGMSALQASRKYGVPSRTLYDKVKKMGITTGRQVQRKSLPNYPSQFPGLGGGMMNMNDMDDREDTNDSSLGAPGDAMDGRATMVPPSGLSTYMLSIMKGMRDSECGSGKGEGGGLGGPPEISLTPMNLSTMLSSSSAKHQRASENTSLSPRSPRPHQRDLDEDTVDSSVDQLHHHHSSAPPLHHRVRHSSAENDLKSRFLADLHHRMGRNIPTQSTSGNHSEQHAASSTTHSPPQQTTPTKMEEENLPPRKRKVSQERPGEGGECSPPGGYNGINGSPPAPSGSDDKDDPIDCRN